MAVAVPCSDGIAVALRVGMGTDTAPDIGHLRREHGVDVQRIHQDPDNYIPVVPELTLNTISHYCK